MPIVVACVTGCKPSKLLFYSYTGSCPTSKPPGSPAFQLAVGTNACTQNYVNTGWYVVWCDTPCNCRALPCPVYVPACGPNGSPIVYLSITCAAQLECVVGQVEINDTAFEGRSISDAISMARARLSEEDAYTLVVEWIVTKEAGADPVETVKGAYVIETGGGEST